MRLSAPPARMMSASLRAMRRNASPTACVPTAPAVVMANVLGGAASAPGWDGPGLDERIHHLMAHWPDVKIHWYGKGQRPGRKLGHVTALGDDLDQVRARAVAAARYLADGVVDPAFAFEEEHA